MNNKGPWTDPWGTPEERSLGPDIDSGIGLKGEKWTTEELSRGTRICCFNNFW